MINEKEPDLTDKKETSKRKLKVSYSWFTSSLLDLVKDFF